MDWLLWRSLAARMRRDVRWLFNRSASRVFSCAPPHMARSRWASDRPPCGRQGPCAYENPQRKRERRIYLDGSVEVFVGCIKGLGCLIAGRAPRPSSYALPFCETIAVNVRIGDRQIEAEGAP